MGRKERKIFVSPDMRIYHCDFADSCKPGLCYERRNRDGMDFADPGNGNRESGNKSVSVSVGRDDYKRGDTNERNEFQSVVLDSRAAVPIFQKHSVCISCLYGWNTGGNIFGGETAF